MVYSGLELSDHVAVRHRGFVHSTAPLAYDRSAYLKPAGSMQASKITKEGLSGDRSPWTEDTKPTKINR